MSSNPMQRKTRNAFLGGVLISVIVAGVVIALLLFQMSSIKLAVEEENATVTRYILTRDVVSGEILYPVDFERTQVLASIAGTNEFDISKFEILESNDGTLVFASEITAKIDLEAKTVATEPMFNVDEETLGNDVRVEDFNMIVLPMDLQTGDTIDVRIVFPTGASYVVLSKKTVSIPYVGYSESAETIRMSMSEEEITTIYSAIVDAYQTPGTKLYANKYVEPGLQNGSEITYAVNEDAIKAIDLNKNLLTIAKNELITLYGKSRSQINTTINKYIEEDANSNVESGMIESIVKSQEERTEYLESMQQSVY